MGGTPTTSAARGEGEVCQAQTREAVSGRGKWVYAHRALINTQKRAVKWVGKLGLESDKQG